MKSVNEKEFLVNSRKNITVWGLPNESLQSQYGNVTYRSWCEKEIDRIKASGGDAVLVENSGMIAVARP